jgi:hypothetical protein
MGGADGPVLLDTIGICGFISCWNRKGRESLVHIYCGLILYSFLRLFCFYV